MCCSKKQWKGGKPERSWWKEIQTRQSTKIGCNTGDCGACSVLVDNRLVCACLVLAAEVEGKSVQTVEGIANGSELHPVQQKLLEHGGLQCGICTPGVVVAAKALLEHKPDPTEEQARYWLAGNLCRCTGYDKIIRAVMDTAAVISPGAHIFCFLSLPLPLKILV